MKRVQENLAFRLCAVVVLLAGFFGCGVLGIRAVMTLDSVFAGSWRDTTRFYSAVDSRRRELVNAVEAGYRLAQLGEKIKDGSAGVLDYADEKALRQELERTVERFDAGNTWFGFRLLLADSQLEVWTNLDPERSEALLWSAGDTNYYSFELSAGEGAYLYTDDMNYNEEQAPPEPETGSRTDETIRLVVQYGVPAEVDGSIADEFAVARAAYDQDRARFSDYLTGTLLLGGLALAAGAALLWAAGHKAGEEKIVLTWQERIFFDLYLTVAGAAGGLLAICGTQVTEELLYQSMLLGNLLAEDYQNFMDLGILGAAALFTGAAAALVLILRTLAVRLKAGVLTKTTLLCRVAAWMVGTIHEFVLGLPITWKVILGYAVFFAANLFFEINMRYNELAGLIWLGLHASVLLVLCWWTVGYHRLRKGTTTIAGGNLEYQIDTHRMPYDLRRQAEDLNNISVGLAGAVDEKMKSERFKAELITNVSHDLKTPLTSIINYVNLLKTTQQADPKAREYIEVLERKSQRLKKLTEDLVEASKASTGVLSVQREKIGMSQLLDQALGEWEERLENKKLTVVTTQPEGETWVYADGRHLWRVIDNLLSNCAKYAMEGTRIYLDLNRGHGQVSLSVKNISREPLNVPPERLMERFVRGEESRTTEGSGLGLSIARSLTELQGGTFQLAVDGDLFKAVVALPQAN